MPSSLKRARCLHCHNSQLLRLVSCRVSVCGPRAALYLAAAVSDFFVPWCGDLRCVPTMHVHSQSTPRGTPCILMTSALLQRITGRPSRSTRFNRRPRQTVRSNITAACVRADAPHCCALSMSCGGADDARDASTGAAESGLVVSLQNVPKMLGAALAARRLHRRQPAAPCVPVLHPDNLPCRVSAATCAAACLQAPFEESGRLGRSWSRSSSKRMTTSCSARRAASDRTPRAPGAPHGDAAAADRVRCVWLCRWRGRRLGRSISMECTWWWRTSSPRGRRGCSWWRRGPGRTGRRAPERTGPHPLLSARFLHPQASVMRACLRRRSQRRVCGRCRRQRRRARGTHGSTAGSLRLWRTRLCKVR